MMKFGIIGKTLTSNEETVIWKSLVVLCEHVENNLVVNELDYGLEHQSSRETTQQTTDKDDKDDRLRKTVVKLAPMFYERVFRKKNRVSNVGASQLQDQ